MRSCNFIQCKLTIIMPAPLPSYQYYDSDNLDYTPSWSWLENPAWIGEFFDGLHRDISSYLIDGGIYLAVYFSSHSQINEAYFCVKGKVFEVVGEDARVSDLKPTRLIVNF